jgi:glutathione S-transferase
MGNVLYSFRRCPYAMRARMALAVANIDYEHREILLRDKPASMLAVSQKGTVPVLIADNDQIIDESIDVMLWALDQSDPENWLQPGLNTMRPLIDIITGDFKHHLDRYKYASRYESDAGRFSVNLEHRDQAVAILGNFEQILTDTPYLMGDKPSLADFATFPFVRQFANVEREWWNTPVFPKLHAWLENQLSSELFIKIMKKHELWVDPVAAGKLPES